MTDTHATALLKLEDAVNTAIFQAEESGLSPKEIAAELRRIAGEVESGQ